MRELGERAIIVTSENFPKIFEAFETISHDAGNRAGHEYYHVPEGFGPMMERFERALKSLNKEYFEIFCVGEQEEVKKIANISFEFYATHKFLNDFFEEWN